MRAGDLAALAALVDPLTPIDVELLIPDDVLAAWGWDVGLDVELDRVDVTGRNRLIIVTRPV